MSLFKSIPAFILRLGSRGNDPQGHTGDTNGEKYSALFEDSATRITKSLGNGCGHDKTSPLAKPKRGKDPKKPLSIEIPIKNLYVYAKDLNSPYLSRLKHPNDRRRRSELRDIIALFNQALLECVDLCTLQIGNWQENGEFSPLPIEYFKDNINTHLPELQMLRDKRVQRFLKAMKKAGYIETYEIKLVDKNGEYFSLAAIRRYTPQFFYDLGVSQAQLAKDRAYRERKLIEQSKKHTSEVWRIRERENVLHRTTQKKNSHISSKFIKNPSKPLQFFPQQPSDPNKNKMLQRAAEFEAEAEARNIPKEDRCKYYLSQIPPKPS